MSKQDSELVINGISSYNQQKGEKKKKKTCYLKAWPRRNNRKQVHKTCLFLSDWLSLVGCNIWDRTVWVYSFLCLPKTDADYHTRCPAETKLSKGKYQVESCQSVEWMASFYTPENILIRICFNVHQSFYFKCIAYFKNNNFPFKSMINTCP